MSISISITHLTYIQGQISTRQRCTHENERLIIQRQCIGPRRTKRTNDADKRGMERERRVAAPPMPERNDRRRWRSVLHTWSPEDEAIGGGSVKQRKGRQKRAEGEMERRRSLGYCSGQLMIVLGLVWVDKWLAEMGKRCAKDINGGG